MMPNDNLVIVFNVIIVLLFLILLILGILGYVFKRLKKRNFLSEHFKSILIIDLILFIIVIISSIYNYSVGPPSYRTICESRLSSWCEICEKTNWHGVPINEDLVMCSNEYWNSGWTTYDDCDVSNAKEICKIVGIS